MPTHRAIAFAHEPGRVIAHAEAFAEGCKRHGIPCEVRRSNEAREPQKDITVIWHYGLGEGGLPFRTYKGKALRVGGDSGYFRGLVRVVPQPQRYIRISVEGAQLGGLMNQRQHSVDRFNALGIDVQPVTSRGDYVLVTGRSPYDAKASGMDYGQWERATVARLQAVTKRQIVLRHKPKNPPIQIPGVRSHTEDVHSAIRGAWAVVCRSGNIGADAIVHGVPCFAELGPGAVYQKGSLEEIDSAEPLSLDERMNALADIAHWQWSTEETARGELWAHLKAEGLV